MEHKVQSLLRTQVDPIWTYDPATHAQAIYSLLKFDLLNSEMREKFNY